MSNHRLAPKGFSPYLLLAGIIGLVLCLLAALFSTSSPGRFFTWKKKQSAVNWRWFGAQISDLTAEDATALGLQPGSKGAIIDGLIAGGRAAQADLQLNDLIVELNNESVDSADTFWSLLSEVPPGDDFTLGVLRHGQPARLSLMMGDPQRFSLA
jgi:S1-C subfamily serine protease